MTGIVIKTVTASSPEYPAVLELREEVLRKPLGLSLKNEDLSRDASDKIVITLQNDKVIGCLMLHHKEDGILKLRAMAVYEEFRTLGIGTLLVKEAEKIASVSGYQKIDLHARVIAQPFYQKLGYIVVSDTFTEVGIPHVVMEKRL